MLAVGKGVTVTNFDVPALQLLLVTVTLYVVLVPGDTVIEEVVAPVFHR